MPREALQRGEMLLDRYEVLQLVGSGGYGQIYKARQTTTEQLVALKVLVVERLEDQARRREEEGRFRREMQLIGRLSHPHVVRLIDSGISHGRRLMVLEYLDGRTLAEALASGGPLQPHLVQRIFVQVLDALAEAHQHGIIHRDLKPQNIMLCGPDSRPNVKVLDFGIAGIVEEKQDESYEKLTQRGTIPGTPSYMAPEQIRFGRSSPASDLYSVGLILLESLTGKRAVTGDNVGDICVKQVTEPVPIPDHVRSSPLGPLISQALSKDPRARHASAEAMLADLESRVVNGTDHDEGPESDGVVDGTAEQASRAPVIMALLAIILVVAALTVTLLARS